MPRQTGDTPSRRRRFVLLVLLAVLGSGFGAAADVLPGSIPAFVIDDRELILETTPLARTPVHQTGRRFAWLGQADGSGEAWAYPLKILRNFSFSFLAGEATHPIAAAELLQRLEVTPARFTITWVHQSFTVKAHYLAARQAPGALILLEVHTTAPLTIIGGFIPLLQPMWPGGLGGQYAFWSDEERAYIISESSRRHHAMVGSPAARGVSYTPAHMLSDQPNEFRIDIPDHSVLAGRLIPVALAGGRGKREEIIAVYRDLLARPEDLYRQNVGYFQDLRRRTVAVSTPVPQLNEALEWAKVALDGLRVDNPDLGTGLVAGLGASGGSGRPGFGWFFGGDAFINSLSFNRLGLTDVSREALEFMRRWQREDGKMAHELTQAAQYVDWFTDYPYAYIHGDTTPLYIVAVADYCRHSGDRTFAAECRPSLEKAYQWCLTTDADGDGLMDNARAGLGALEYGALTGIRSDIYLNGVWVQAAREYAWLTEWLAHSAAAAEAETVARAALMAFRAQFWNNETQFYAYAFTADGRHVTEFSPWSAPALWWELGEPECSVLTLQRLARADLSTDWGVRSISRNSAYYQPLNYNYGAVWPFLTGWTAAAHYRHNLVLPGTAALLANVRHTVDRGPGMITEVFSGDTNIWPGEAVAQQGFSSSGVVLPLLGGLLGLDVDVPGRRLGIAPRFPADWEMATVENIHAGDSRFRLTWRREAEQITISVIGENAAGYSLGIAPVLGPGVPVREVRVNGQAATFTPVNTRWATQPRWQGSLPVDGLRLEFRLAPAVEILPPRVGLSTGDTDRGLKISVLRQETDGTLFLAAEGRSGVTYQLGVVHPELIAEVHGARLRDGILELTVPPGPPDIFQRVEVRIAHRP
ncbi:MAG: hypothetical protein JXQ27_10165 [Acidobacteria bacterium]|nr:hypothetical protein [Acidobacteriota bacterium]